MVTKEQLRRIRKYARAYHGKLDFFHGVWHLDNTLKLARRLQKVEGGKLDIILAGAMLHQLHDGKKALQILKEIGVDASEAKKIAHCVAVCNPFYIQKNEAIETQIVYDADKLQWCGVFGFAKEYLCNTLVRRKNPVLATIDTLRIERESIGALQTLTARRIPFVRLW